MTKITAPGRYSLSMSQYRGQPCDGMSMSSSDACVLSCATPAHLRAAWEEPEKRERKVALGVAVHVMALEPARSSSAIAVVKADDFKTNAAKDAADEALAAGKTPLLEKDYERAGRVVEALRAHPIAGHFLAAGDVEQSWFARDAGTGIWKKARPDLFAPDETLVDVKTVGSAHPDFIKRRIFDGGWYQQAPWHCDVVRAVLGHEPADYLWIIVEQEPPHAVIVRRPSAGAMDAGQRKNAEALQTFAACVKSGQWPAYAETIEEIGLPDFAHFKLEDEAMNGAANKGMEAAHYSLQSGASPFG